jgi:hypothetical protein
MDTQQPCEMNESGCMLNSKRDLCDIQEEMRGLTMADHAVDVLLRRF